MNADPWSKSDAQNDLFPATNISYKHAIKFCKSISKEFKKNYTIPTELQWEYACRCNSDYLFSWGSSNVEDIQLANRYSLFRQPKQKPVGLEPVGQRQPNPFGLFDTIGLVAEFVSGRYDVDPIRLNFINDNIPEKAKDYCFNKGIWSVCKGGGFDSALIACTYLNRTNVLPGNEKMNCGFRLVEN